jgi:hypothetical protein
VIGRITKIRDVLCEVVDALEELAAGIGEENEEKIQEALDMMPASKVMVRHLEDLGLLLQTMPWEGGKKGKKNA